MVAGANGRPTICLNLIVKNEAHIIHEMIEAVARYIDYWVIVDTGSTDGTQDVIRDHMARLGIPGEIHERPWRDFGYNRSEALQLAQNHCDYIWVMDADDTIAGEMDFSNLTADVYSLRIDDGVVYWRLQLFKNGLPWYYKGVLHELPVCDVPYHVERMEGDYRILSRRIGGRNLDPEKYLRDAEILLAEVQRNPDDPRSTFYLAQSYFCYQDWRNSWKWDQRRADMGGWEEEVYYSLFRVAEAMARLGEPWPEVQDAYLRAWNYRPHRAEALHALARHHRLAGRYPLGHLFASRAAEMPHTDDVLFVNSEVHNWRALDEQGVCASWINRPVEAFNVSRRILACPGVPPEDRQRIIGNRDLQAPVMLRAATAYPDRLPMVRPGDDRRAEVTVSLVAGHDRKTTEESLNSFLRCCTDIDKIDRFLVLDAGLSAGDRAVLGALYPFLEFMAEPAGPDPGVQLQQIRATVSGRYWLHLWAGWRFFAPDALVTRLVAVLEAEPEVFQVGVNFEDATELTGRAAGDELVRTGRDTGRYVLTDTVLNGPAMFDVVRSDYAFKAWRPGETVRSATLDEVLCVRNQQ